MGRDGFEMILFTIFGFLLGSIPFSLIFTRLIVKKNLREIGDGNPGGTNAVKAGGAKVGIPSIICDIGKGFLPVYLAKKYGVTGMDLIPVGLAPILGHAFSPFLKFHGGKSLGATGGVWVGLIGFWAFPVYASLALPFTLLQTEDAWSANAGMISLVSYSLLFGPKWMVIFSVLNTLLIIYTHRHDLVRTPHFRPWLIRFLQGREA